MKLLLCISIALSAFFSTTEKSLAPNQHALIIAIGNYPRIGGWDKLSSVHDAELLEPSLRALGFTDLQKLVDSEATKAGIMQAFQELTARVAPGDLVFVHYSGHGQQVWDHDDPVFAQRRKDEVDGFDESLVPYDARDSFTPGVYEGENHLVDDEISYLLNDLRSSLGPTGQLVFTVDACFSGSISRSASLAKIRGTSKLLQPENYEVGSADSGKGTGMEEAFASPGQALSPMAVISAARADQPNYETTDPQGVGVGSLSLALSKTLLRPFDQSPSLSTFFRYVQTDMAGRVPYQSPQLEGEGDRQLFGNSLLPPGGYPVLEISADGLSASILAGELAGLAEGTKVKLVKNGSAEEGIEGVIEESEATQSSIRLNAPLPDIDPVAWKVRVEERYLLFQPVALGLELKGPELDQQLRNDIGKTHRMNIVEEGAQLLLRESDNGMLVLTDLQENELGHYPASPADKASLQAMARIEQFLRAQYFRGLGGHSGEAGLAIESVPVELRQEGGLMKVSTVLQGGQESAGILSMNMDTPFIFRIENKTGGPRFFSVVGVDAGDDVFLLLPDARTAPAEFVVPADTAILFQRPEWIFKTAEPAGKQVFVVIASEKPIDLRPVFQQTLGPTRGAVAPESQWMSDLLFGNTRSAGLGEGVETASTIMEIMP